MKKKERAFDNYLRTNRLAGYNAEKARGIAHTDEWKEFMRKEQEWFDVRQEQGNYDETK